VSWNIAGPLGPIARALLRFLVKILALIFGDEGSVGIEYMLWGRKLGPVDGMDVTIASWHEDLRSAVAIRIGRDRVTDACSQIQRPD
jgi:hypothetical protein